MTPRIAVVIVDDDESFRGMLRLLLQAEGVDVVGEAADGAEGVARVGELEPEAVIMDLTMPVMDGVAATRAIRLRFPSVRVIGLTSAEPSHAVEMLDAGAVEVVPKAQVGSLVQAIRSALGGPAPE